MGVFSRKTGVVAQICQDDKNHRQYRPQICSSNQDPGDGNSNQLANTIPVVNSGKPTIEIWYRRIDCTCSKDDKDLYIVLSPRAALRINNGISILALLDTGVEINITDEKL